MTLSNAIIEQIKQKSGLLFDKAGDFDLLSMYVFKQTGRTIGVTTLKRLFNYINDDRKANEFTLNTIALYLGHETWEEYIKMMNIDSVWGFDDPTVYIHALEVGTHVDVTYLDRKVMFVVTERNGQNVLRVEKATNSSLHAGDECEIYRIRKGCVLEAEKVYRGENVGNYKTKGEISSVSVYDL